MSFLNQSPVSARTAGISPSLIRTLHDAKTPTSLNLGLGQPSLSVDHTLLQEGFERLQSADMGYTANAGQLSLREAIAKHHNISDCLSPENVVVTCGSQEAILATMAAVLDVGDEVILADPCFPGYKMAAQLLSATCKTVPRDPATGFRLNTSDIAAALTPRTKLVVVNSPSNPTGAIDSEDEFQKLATLSEERGFAILSDEIYADICYQSNTCTSSARKGKNTILVSGLSKSCAMTGFRLGYVIAQKHLITAILRSHSIATTCAPTISQHMAQIVFENPTRLKAHLNIYKERRESALSSLQAFLPQVPILPPDGSFYILANMSAYTDNSLDFSMKILKEVDVITTPGSAFGSVLKSWLRLSFAGESSEFKEGILRISGMLS